MDHQYNWMAMTAPYGMCSSGFRREVNVLSTTFDQSLFADRFQKAGGGAVVENPGWLAGIETQLDGNRVSLVGSKALTIVRESEALLVVLRHHLCEFVTRSVLAGT